MKTQTVITTLLTLVALASPAHAATVTVSSTAPVASGYDIAQLTGTDGPGDFSNVGKWWAGAAANPGQTFRPTQTGILKSFTLKNSTTITGPVFNMTIRVSTVSGTNLTVIRSESAQWTNSSAVGDFITYTLATPLLLASNTLYGIDVAFVSSSVSYQQSGIPYLYFTKSSPYSGGAYYTVANGGTNITLNNSYDRTFYLRIQDLMTPSPDTGTTYNPGGSKTVSWSGLPPNTGSDVWVDVWFGTNPTALTQVVSAGLNITNATVSAPTAATYYWRVDYYLNGAPTGSPVTGNLWNFVITDSDGDGIPDAWMMTYFGHPTGLASDHTRAQDDFDGDGLTNLQEYQLGTNPTNTDTDGDGLTDGDEVNLYHTNPTKADTDGDGLNDGAEVNTYHTNPLLADTDGDGLSDGAEVNTYHTNPLVTDTDGDGVGDWYEVTATFTSPTNSADKPNIPYPLPKPDGSKGVTNKPVKVFILSGQSNMVGMGDVNGTDANGVALPGTLNFITKVQNKFPDLLKTNGSWSVWSNVMYRGVVTALGNAPLQPGQGAGSGNLGPELGFGRVMGYYMNEPVLLIKSSQGNRGLFWDILPPGSPRYTNGTTVYAGYGEGPNSWGTTTNGGPSPYVWYAGKQYDDFFLAAADMGAPEWVNGTLYNATGQYVRHNGQIYTSKATNTASSASEPGVGAQSTTYWNVYSIENVTTVLDNFATQYPQWAAQGFEISGYVWFQGNWDIANGSLSANRYETNLINLIKTLRQYYANRYPGKCSTNTPFVLATGCGDPGTSGNGLIVANAQLAMNDTNKYPEFAGNVKAMDTRAYWRDLSVSPNAQGYHYYHNAETYMLTGDALGRGMISLLSAGTVATNDYSSWATNYPGANLSDPNADFDGDGVSNEQERIWGLNPTNAASCKSLTFTSSLPTGNFSYTRRDPALTGLNYTVWTSTNLVNWTQDTGAVQTPGGPVNQVQSVSVTVSPGLVTGSRLFIRMVAQ